MEFRYGEMHPQGRTLECLGHGNLKGEYYPGAGVPIYCVNPGTQLGRGVCKKKYWKSFKLYIYIFRLTTLGPPNLEVILN